MPHKVSKQIDRIFHRHPIDVLASVNGVVSGLALYPQLVHLMRGGDATGISLTTFILIAVTSFIWCIYAIHRRTSPTLVSASANLIASALIIALVITSR